jgi:hypothetical protein
MKTPYLMFFIVGCCVLNLGADDGHGRRATDVTVLDDIDTPLEREVTGSRSLSVDRATHIALNSAEKPYRRARAVAWLMLNGSDRGRRTVEMMIRDEPDLRIRRQAIVSFSRIYGLSNPDKVRTVLMQALDHLPAALFRGTIVELNRLGHAPRPTHQR